MQRHIIYLVLALLLAACKGRDKAEPAFTDETAFAGVDLERPADDQPIIFDDSLDAATPEDQRTPPPSVDRNFDDFLYAFNTCRRFFVDRIALPFPATQGGTQTQMTRYADVRTLYRQALQEGYSILHTSRRELDDLDRGAIREADVDAIDLAHSTVLTFHFERGDSRWQMLSSHEQPLTQYPAGRFLAFYARFATDPAYRLQHLAPVIDITLPSDAGPISGNIAPAQFDAFVTDLAQGTLVNIRLGQTIDDAAPRMYIRRCNLSMGDERILAFRRDGNAWTLRAVM